MPGLTKADQEHCEIEHDITNDMEYGTQDPLERWIHCEKSIFNIIFI